MRLTPVLAVVVVAAAAPASSPGQARVLTMRALSPSRGSPWRLDTVATQPRIAPDTAKGVAVITDVSADSGGHILAVDAEGRRLVVLDDRLRVLGTLGRAGTQPGEYRFPYLLAVGDDGATAVLDLTNVRLTLYGRDLRLLDTATLDDRVNATSMLLIGDEVFVAGVLDPPDAQGAAIHVFGRDGRHHRSFGHLVETATPEIRRFIGGGLLSRSSSGGVWYAQYSPYLIERYRLDGTLDLRIQRPNSFLPSAEGAFRIHVDGSSTVFAGPSPHARTAAILELGDTILVHQTLLANQRVVSDIYRPGRSGTWALVASREYDGPVMLRRGPDNTFLGLVASDEIRHGGIVRVRVLRGPQ